ncbi:MAG TPA: hypothetical protein VH137_06170 [Gemmatimonadales bacterium]|nr:hypothetical protein [Gemmatimonadales bacterium]
MRAPLALAALGAVLARGSDRAPAPAGLGSPPAAFDVVVLPAALREAMSTVWIENNRHWDELADQNTLTQLIGTGKPTQHEYLGCLAGDVVADTLFVRHLVAAAHLRQLQFAVGGNCDGVERFVGTWHTHPYRADTAGRALKERALSTLDLTTFAAAHDVVALAMWDVDSLDAAAKRPDGSVRHPAPLTVR